MDILTLHILASILIVCAMSKRILIVIIRKEMLQIYAWQFIRWLGGIILGAKIGTWFK